MIQAEKGCFPHNNKSQLVWKDLIWEEGKQLDKEVVGNSLKFFFII